jgi:hypothetical protein
MAIRFDTYAELGEAIRKKNPQAFEGRNSESIGIDFSEKFGDKIGVRIREEKDRASFKFDPEETGVGENILKSLGNVPYSAKEDLKDVATAIFNPIDTAEGLARGAAGGIELALGTNISPENKRLAEQMGEGFREAVSLRGLVERPTSILGLLAGGTGLGAKAVGTAGKIARGSRVVPRLTKAARQKADTKAAIKRSERGGLGKKVAMAGAKVEDAATKVDKFSQAIDPAMFLPRGAYAGTKAGAKAIGRPVGRFVGKGATMAGRGALRAGEAVTRPIREVGVKAFEALNDIQLDDNNALVKFAKKVANDPRASAKDAYGQAKDMLGTARAKAGKAAEEVTDQPHTLGGTMRGLGAAALGFTFGTGDVAVQKLFDIALGARGRQGPTEARRKYEMMRSIINNTDDAKMSEDLVKNFNEVLNDFYENESNIHAQYRKDLDMDNVEFDFADPEGVAEFAEGTSSSLAQELKERLKGTMEEGFTLNKDGSIKDFRLRTDLAASPANKQAIKNVYNIINDMANKRRITVTELDQLKRLLSDYAYGDATGGISDNLSATLGDMRRRVRVTVDDVLADPEKYNLQRTTNPEGFDPKLYSKAMYQWFGLQDAMSDIKQAFGANRPDVRTFAGVGEDGKLILRQPGEAVNDPVLVDRILNSFNKDNGLALRTITRLAEGGGESGQNLLVRMVGNKFRPGLGGGLQVKADISSGVRGVAGIATASGLASGFGALAGVPATLLMYSPKYGGLTISWLLGPKGKVFTDDIARYATDKAGKAVDYTKAAADAMRSRPSWFEDILESLRLKKKEPTQENVAEGLRDAYEGSQTTNRLTEEQKNLLQRVIAGARTGATRAGEYVDETKITRPRTALRAGVATVRAEEQGEEAQERRNLLSTLGQTQR